MGNTYSVEPVNTNNTVTVTSPSSGVFHFSVPTITQNINSTYYQAELAELTLTKSGATTVTSESGLTSLRVGFSSLEGIGVTSYQIGFPTGQLGLPNQDQGYALDSLRVNDKAYGSTQCGSAAIFVSNSGSSTTVTVYYPTVIFYTNADQIFSVNTFDPVTVTF